MHLGGVKHDKRLSIVGLQPAMNIKWIMAVKWHPKNPKMGLLCT